MPTPRLYQEELHVAVARAIANERRLGKRNISILVRAPTGAGKTFIGSRFMHGAEQKGNDSLFMAPRRELVYQTAKRLRTFGVDPGIIMAGEAMHQKRLCQVASADTLHRRGIKRGTILLPRAKLVIPDEAHLWAADTRANLLRALAGDDSIRIGLTATPARPDGRPMRDLFDVLVEGWDERQMMDEGYLVDCQYFAPSKPDLRAVRTKARDYHEGDLEKEMTKPKIIGDVIDNWFRLARNQPTVTFCVTKVHARFIADEFRRHGVEAACVTAETKDEERWEVYGAVASGEIKVLVNVFVASYGLDIPPLAVCQLARPTKSLVLYRQMGGRILRPLYADWATEAMLEESAEIRLAAIADSTKPFGMVIDHAGAVDRHGYLDDPVPWAELMRGDADADISELKERAQREREEPKQVTCSNCKFVFKGTRYCPKCGHEMIAPGKPLPYHAADLVEKVRDGKEANKKEDWGTKAEFMAQAKGYARSKGYKDGYASSLYRDKYGVWPNDPRVHDVAAKPPGEVIKNFIKHKAIKRRFTKAPA